jgi:Kef-type K+ transport system membrane component KefB
MRNLLAVYVLTLAVFGAGICWILQQGKDLKLSEARLVEQGAALPTPDLAKVEASSTIWSNLAKNAQRPFSRLLVQLILILVAARIFGSLFARFGQPSVVGEMFAGILLGPSLLGWVWPGAFQGIFSKESLETPRLLSQIGVCLYLFVQGMEIELSHLKEKASSAVMVSHVSIVFPFFLGVCVALPIYPRLGGVGSPFQAFALFMGIAMSITAFPVLARILEERKLTKTPLGGTALTCAAADDMTAWSLLALIVAVVEAGNLAAAFLCILLLLAYLVLMLWGVKPALGVWISRLDKDYSRPRFGLLASVLAFVFLSALSTQLAGIHALFGAFLAGIVMPRNSAFSDYLKVRIENFSSVFLLPIFFAYTGLRTQVGLLNNTGDWLLCLALIGVATCGKLGGTLVAARFTGMNWRDSFALGALMNTRGLMELIALNIGYDMGILSPRIFTMMVLMALLTTFLTGPLLTLIQAGKIES